MADHSTLSSFFVSAEASISVLLTAAYGFWTAKVLPHEYWECRANWQAKLVDGGAVKQVSGICSRIFLPAMMIVEMGNQMKDFHTLLHYLPIILWGMASTLIAFLISLIFERLFHLPQWAKLGVCFPNALSLPLLLLNSLQETHVIESLLWGPDDTVAEAVRRGRTYILINSLTANVMRFSLGPAMLKKPTIQSSDEDVIPQHTAPHEGTALLTNSEPRARFVHGLWTLPKRTYKAVKEVWNPPLTGAVLAICIGLIPPLKHEFYHREGFFFGTVTTSLTNIGELFTALMLFSLGAGLQIKSQGDARTPILVLLYIYVMRFILMPLIGIVVVWRVSHWGWLNDDAHEGLGGDPMMKFIMCLIPAGPPYFAPSEFWGSVDLRRAIVLANIAELAGVGEDQIGKLLILSYVVSPTIAFTVAAALRMITSLS